MTERERIAKALERSRADLHRLDLKYHEACYHAYLVDMTVTDARIAMDAAAALLRSEPVIDRCHGDPSCPAAAALERIKELVPKDTDESIVDAVKRLLTRSEPVGESVADMPEFSATLLLPTWFTIDEVLDVEEKLREAIYAITDRDVYVRCKRALPAPPAAPEAQDKGDEPCTR